jgi:hypothetical protein
LGIPDFAQSVEKPEIQENWISGFTCFIIKVAKHENAEEKLSGSLSIVGVNPKKTELE